MSRRPISRRLRPLRHALELFAARLAISFVTRLSEPQARALGAALGRASGTLLLRRTRIARANLRVVFPQLDAAAREQILRASLEESGVAAVEWARMPLLDAAALRERCEVIGLEHFDRAIEQGRGAFAATAHFGSWEVLPALVLAHRPTLPLVVVGRELRNRRLYEWIRARREQGGATLLAQDARAILRALRAGSLVGVLVDQYTTQRRGGVLVPFLGVNAWSNSGPALLALRTGAAIVPAHVHRGPDGRLRLVIEPAIEIAPTGDRAADVRSITARLAEVLGRAIHEDPAPWLWSHRRFRRSPDLPDDLYERRAER